MAYFVCKDDFYQIFQRGNMERYIMLMKDSLKIKNLFLGSLKIHDLSYYDWLARTPNLLGLPNLDRLILKGCVSLVKVCESSENLEMLDLLDLQYCNILRKLPRNIGKIGSLKTLIISGCNIGELPIEMRNMQSLEVLNAERIIINSLRTSSGEVRWWERIIWPMGTFQYHVFRIYLKGREIPTFTGEKCEGSSIRFTMPSSSLPTNRRRIQWLNALCKFEITNFNLPAAIGTSVTIENNTKSLTWIHRSNYVLFHIYAGWLSRWKRFGNQLEAGYEIIIMFDCSNHCEVKGCGLKIEYRDPDEEEKGSTSTIEESHHHFPALRLSRGTLFCYQMFEEDS
ncbi:hypothetical protein LguiA_008160 [Lonicera macranthoides]